MGNGMGEKKVLIPHEDSIVSMLDKLKNHGYKVANQKASVTHGGLVGS